MLTWEPRRYKLNPDWPYRPQFSEWRDDSPTLRLKLPFYETLAKAFDDMCNIQCTPKHMRRDQNPPYVRCFTYLDSPLESEMLELENWWETVGAYVAIRDCIELSFALDYGNENGDPSQPETEIRRLRQQAKIYNKDTPSPQTYEAANELAARCTRFLEQMTCYNPAQAVIAVPPSDPRKTFSLPRYLASQISEERGLKNLSESVFTKHPRKSVKGTVKEQKLEILRGTIQIDPEAICGTSLLLIDDLYQSGVTANYTAMLLLQAGAREVFSLACEKTNRNDDNTSRG